MTRRKRKAHSIFMNNKRWCASNVKRNNSENASNKNNAQTETAINARLLNLSRNEIEVDSHQTDDEKQYIIIDTTQLKKLFENFDCPTCLKKALNLKVGRKLGFATELIVVCEECREKASAVVSSSDPKDKTVADVNLRMTQAFDYLAKGYSAIEKFCMVMNMSPFSSKTFYKCFDQLNTANTLTAKNMFEDIHKEIKKSYKEDVLPSDIVNISVSFDGTWLTRGYSSLIGVGCVIDILTGYVVDFKIMSKVCRLCSNAVHDLGHESAEFSVWYEGHKSTCDINHKGSSGSMEMLAAEVLWKRSESFGFRYTTMLSDGDCKTFDYLTQLQVYGSNVSIQKEECVNHVSKRLGTALRKAVQEWRARGVTLGGKRHGSLKEGTIKKLTMYYQRAILKNKGDADNMKSAIYATLYHSISTDSKPQHSKCPEGKESWCFYQASIAQGKKPGSHQLNVKTPVNEKHLSKILPIYQRLASTELLQRCIRCHTQNANESLHSIIWSRCPKEIFVNKQRVKCSVSNVVCEYNKGILHTLKRSQKALGLSVGNYSLKLGAVIDLRKRQYRKRRSTAKFQHARKLVKNAIAKRERQFKKKEGVTYAAGSF